MATTARNKKIGELFLTAAGQKAGPSIINREIALNTRLEACETLVKLRGGLGRHSRDRLKKILAEIVAAAKVKLESEEFQKVVDRLEIVRLRLEAMSDNRADHRKLSAEQDQELRETSQPPFALLDTSPDAAVWWDREIRNGRVHWFLSIPEKLTVHITRRKPDGPREISAGPAV